MSPESVVFNGINGSTGRYLSEGMTTETVIEMAQGKRPDKKYVKELGDYLEVRGRQPAGVIAGVDPTDISQAGWGVIFAHDEDEAVKAALRELLDFRREQAGKYYREYWKGDGYRYDLEKGSFETKNEFLARHGAGPGLADPKKVPYYLLIVGDPQKIPFRFQYQIDVQYAVGRIYFDTLEEYQRYAHSVVAAERDGLKLPKEAAFFGVKNPGDAATTMSADHLITPLVKEMTADQPAWKIRQFLENEADKAQLGRLLGGDQRPALLFTASHGMGFENGDPRQLKDQGALLCQDWPGQEQWQKPIPEDFYFSADDVGPDAWLHGLIAFHFACYGAGTPRLDDFAHRAFENPKAIAPHAFLSRLPQRLLSHPANGALAVVGHVERAWSYSFMWNKAGEELSVFKSMLKVLMENHPIGSALEYFNLFYAEISTMLNARLEDLKFGNQEVSELEVAGFWTANNDARSYVVIGDPAVRLPVSDMPSVEKPQPLIEVMTGSATSTPSTPPPAPESDSEQPAGEVDYGLMESLKATQESLRTSLQEFGEKLTDVMKRLMTDVTTLDVSTYVSNDMGNVTYDAGKGEFTGAAKPWARTIIKLDGDIQHCFPAGEIDPTLLSIHKDTIEQAMQQRDQMFTTIRDVTKDVLKMLNVL